MSLKQALAALCCLVWLSLTVQGQCPQTVEFESWLARLSSNDPLVRLSTAFSQPPLPENTIVSAACLDKLLASPDAPSHRFLVASLSEAPVAEERFIELTARDLTNTDEQVALQAAVALSRRGNAATPIVLKEFLQPSIADLRLRVAYSEFETSCEGLYRPWVLASLALERIGKPAVPAIVLFLKSHPTSANENIEQTQIGLDRRTWRSYLFNLLGRLDQQSFVSLYEANPAFAAGPDSSEFLSNLFTLPSEQLHLLFQRHLELLPIYRTWFIEWSYWARDPSTIPFHAKDLGLAAEPTLLTGLRDAKDEMRLFSLRAFLESPPTREASYVGKALITELMSPSKAKKSWTDLVLDHNIKPFAYAGITADLHRLIAARSPLLGIAAWKGLRDLQESAPDDLKAVLTEAVNQISL